MLVEISIGELVDKVTILSIKLDKIHDEEKIKNIKKEYDILYEMMLSVSINEKNSFFIELKKINELLWETEEKVRKEFNNDKKAEFSRIIHTNNDERANIKKRINLRYNSNIVEEKSYKGML